MDIAINPLTLQRRRRLVMLAAAAALVAVCASAWAINRALLPSVAAADIRVVPVTRGDIANAINAAGVVIPMHEELLAAPIQTRVAKVRAKLGQSVAAGQVLLELDDRTIRLALDSIGEQLAQQENRIDALTQELAAKRKQITSAIELLEIDVHAATVKRERYTTLRKAGGVSGEDMLTAELNVTRFEIQLRQQRELIGDTQRATTTSIDGARLQKNILRKQLAQQQELLERTLVRAPFAGMLTMLVEEEGASLALGQQVARVSEPDNYRVEASLSDFHATSLAPGQRVTVEQGKTILTGKVQTVLPEIQNGTIKLMVALDEPSHAGLRNKMRVDVNIITAQKTGALVAASGPAFNGRGRQTAFVIRDGVARRTLIDIGAADGKAVEILSGATLGERVIVSDISAIKDYDSVRVTQ
jgi:HlyD family secretion protein